MDTDVVIVGAGIAGALVAARLAKAGVKVTIVEAGPRVERGSAEGRFPAYAMLSRRARRS